MGRPLRTQLWPHLFRSEFRTRSRFRTVDAITRWASARLSFISNHELTAAVEQPVERPSGYGPQLPGASGRLRVQHAVDDQEVEQVLDRRMQLQDGRAHGVIALPLEHRRELTQVFLLRVGEAIDPDDLSFEPAGFSPEVPLGSHASVPPYAEGTPAARARVISSPRCARRVPF